MQELEQAFQQVTDAANNHHKPAAGSASDETIIMPPADAGANSTRQPQSGAPRPPKPVENPAIRRNRKIAIISISVAAAVLVLSILIFVGVYFYQTADNGLILDNVYVAGVNLGGMTPEEARTALQKAAASYAEQDLVIRLPDATLTLSPVDTDAAIPVDELITQAFGYGRDGSRSQRVKAAAAAKLSRHTIDLLPVMTLNTGYIQEAIENFHASQTGELVQPQITVEGEKPEGQPDLTDPEADPTKEVFQTITIVLGSPKRDFDANAVYKAVLDAYNHNDFTPIEPKFTQKDPKPVDLSALAKEHNLAPVNAEIDEKDYSVTKEQYGYGFVEKDAAALLEKAGAGETVRLELHYLAPEKTEKSLKDELFKDVLAEYDSIYYLNPPRTTNLELACAAIDGYVLLPGEVFSFNDIVGERTPEKGYQPAGAYVDGETVDQVGGGICQVASTLYYCSLYADLEIVERYEHMYSVDYVPLGLDATINWGTLDYRFRNNTQHPILIEANARDSYVTIRLRGVDDKDYYVEMEYEVLEELEWEDVEKEFPPDNEEGYEDGDVIQKYPFNGYIVDTYKCRYSKETDELISREYESHSEYDKKDRITARVPDPEAPSTEPSEAPENP